MRLDSKIRLALFASLLLLLLSLGWADQNLTLDSDTNFEPFISAYKLFFGIREAEQVALIVNNGSGGGSYPTGSLVKVSANRPPEGQHFAGWTGGIVILANPFIATTTAIIPSIPVTITATYCAVEARD
jgi:hypothetical protein